MKKLFSSLVSVFTSAALLSGAALPAVSAEEGTEVLMDYGQITLGDAMQFSANYSENGYNYGVYLDENNVEFYKAFIQLINPSTSTITVKLPEPVSATLSTNSPSAMTEADVKRELDDYENGPKSFEYKVISRTARPKNYEIIPVFVRPEKKDELVQLIAELVKKSEPKENIIVG